MTIIRTRGLKRARGLSLRLGTRNTALRASSRAISRLSPVRTRTASPISGASHLRAISHLRQIRTVSPISSVRTKTASGARRASPISPVSGARAISHSRRAKPSRATSRARSMAAKAIMVLPLRFSAPTPLRARRSNSSGLPPYSGAGRRKKVVPRCAAGANRR